jgi:hypothetical protein
LGFAFENYDAAGVYRTEENGVPVLAISREDAARGKCIECLACETECVVRGAGGGFIDLPVEGLDAWRRTVPGRA